MSELIGGLFLTSFVIWMYRKVKYWDDLNDPPTGAWA